MASERKRKRERLGNTWHCNLEEVEVKETWYSWRQWWEIASGPECLAESYRWHMPKEVQQGLDWLTDSIKSIKQIITTQLQQQSTMEPTYYTANCYLLLKLRSGCYLRIVQITDQEFRSHSHCLKLVPGCRCLGVSSRLQLMKIVQNKAPTVHRQLLHPIAECHWRTKISLEVHCQHYLREWKNFSMK